VLEQAQNELAQSWLSPPTLDGFRYEVLNTFAIPGLTVAEPAADLLALGLLAWGIVATWRVPFARALAVAVLLGVPLASFAISQWRPILNGKTLLWLVPIGLSFVALGCAALPRLRWPALAAALLFQAVATTEYAAARRPDGPLRAAADTLVRASRAGDALVVAPRFLAFALAEHRLPAGALPTFSIGGAATWYPAREAPPLAPESALPALRGFSRVWVAERGEPDSARMLSERLACAFTADETKSFGAIRLLRFDRRTDPNCR
jgi:hypothetical protein